MRRGFNGHVNCIEVLMEACSFIVRHSLLKILREDLLEHFASAASSEAYFGKEGLTRLVLSRSNRTAAP